MNNEKINFGPVRKILATAELGGPFSDKNIRALSLAGFLPLCAHKKILPVEMSLEVLQSTAREAINEIVGAIDESTLNIADIVVEIMFNDLARKPIWENDDEIIDRGGSI